MSNDAFNIAIADIWAVVAGGAAIKQGVYMASPNETVRITVEEKDRGGGRETARMRVYTSEEVFRVSDSLSRGHFVAADVYGRMKAGCTYDATAYGFRLPITSDFRNVVAVQHVPTEACPTPAGPVSQLRPPSNG